MAALIPEITAGRFPLVTLLDDEGFLVIDRRAGGEVWLTTPLHRATTSIPLTAEEFRALGRELLDIAEVFNLMEKWGL